MKRLNLSIAFTLAAAGAVSAQFHLPGTGSTSAPAPVAVPSPIPAAPPGLPKDAAPVKPKAFDYYVLSLSPGHFKVIGLAPQANEGPRPEFCPAKPPSRGAVSLVLPIVPSAAAIRAEWAKHGSCTGLSAADYFTDVLRLRSLIQIPVQLSSLDAAATESPDLIERQFLGANPGFPPAAFRTACAKGKLTEVRVCFDLQLKPRACTAAVGECGDSQLLTR
jgi:ribonuclease I